MADFSKIRRIAYLGQSPSFSCPFPLNVDLMTNQSGVDIPATVEVCLVTASVLDDPTTLAAAIDNKVSIDGLPAINYSL
jgi:hypothetical protein